MKKIKITSLLLSYIFISVTICLVTSCSCNSNKKPVQQLTIGIQNSPSNALVIIANEKSFFDTNIVKVSVKEFTAGKLALLYVVRTKWTKRAFI